MLVNEIEILKLKKILLKFYKNNLVFIDLKGNLETRLSIQKSRILFNKRKIIFANDEIDFTIDLSYLIKIKFDTVFKIILIFKDYHILLEV